MVCTRSWIVINHWLTSTTFRLIPQKQRRNPQKPRRNLKQSCFSAHIPSPCLLHLLMSNLSMLLFSVLPACYLLALCRKVHLIFVLTAWVETGVGHSSTPRGFTGFSDSLCEHSRYVVYHWPHATPMGIMGQDSIEVSSGEQISNAEARICRDNLGLIICGLKSSVTT